MQMYQILGCPLEYRQVVKSAYRKLTEEWSELGSDEIVFAYNKEEGLALHKEIWLSKNAERFNSIKDVMIVGCGAGRRQNTYQKFCEFLCLQLILILN